MNITVDNSITNKFGMPPKRDLSTISEIVIHHTDGEFGWGNPTSGLDGWMLSDTNPNINLYKQFISLFHYTIEKEGSIVQVVPIDSWVYHSCCGAHDAKTIGIELVQGSQPFTDAQYSALTELVQYIYSQCPITQIESHDYNYMTYSKGAKGCPGKLFDWNRFGQMLSDQGLTPTIYSYNGVN